MSVVIFPDNRVISPEHVLYWLPAIQQMISIVGKPTDWCKSRYFRSAASHQTGWPLVTVRWQITELSQWLINIKILKSDQTFRYSWLCNILYFYVDDNKWIHESPHTHQRSSCTRSHVHNLVAQSVDRRICLRMNECMKDDHHETIFIFDCNIAEQKRVSAT